MLLKSNFTGDIYILRCPIILGKKRSYRFGILFGLVGKIPLSIVPSSPLNILLAVQHHQDNTP